MNTDNLDLRALLLHEVFSKAFVDKHYAYQNMTLFLSMNKSAYHPWYELTRGDISILKNWLGVYYPKYGMGSDYDPRFKSGRLH